MAVFPTFARMLRDGFEVTPDYGGQRTPMDDGIAKQRPTRTLPVNTMPVSVLLQTKADLAAWQSWVANDISRGFDWFDWPDPMAGNAIKSARIVNGALKYTPATMTATRVSFSLETLG